MVVMKGTHLRRPSARNESARGEIDRHDIVRRLGAGAVAGRMVFDAQLGRRDDNAQIPVILVIIVLERDLSAWPATSSGDGVRGAPAPAGQLGEGMAAIAANDIRNLRLAVMAGEALVVVRMSRQHRMRPDPGFLADRVNLQKHLFAPAMPLPAL